MRSFRAALIVSALPAIALFLGEGVRAQSAGGDPRGIEFFETKIRPVLIASCYECHSAKASKVKGGLYLDTREGLLAGGDSGEAIVPGKPEESLLIQALRHSPEIQMPPKKKLPESVIADFVRWVAMGAPDPRSATNTAITKITLETARQWWSYKPISKPAAPKVQNSQWPRNEVDRFVLAGLEKQGLRPVADADRATLVRRVYFDLIGLPPPLEELQAALSDSSPAWFEKVVDRLLASPHFGERWGRYWLDAARYAESNGNADNTPFPNAWRYRNWVITAVNQDKPYDRFVTEQVAGDLLPADSPAERDALLTATGFLALTSKPRAQNNPDYRMDLIADQIDVTSRAVLGLSVMCARCHDHKFDPIPTKEYYSLAGIFESSTMLAGAGGKGNKGQPGSKGFHNLSDGGQAMGVAEGQPTNSSICIRGDSTNRGETVPRGFLTVATLSTPPEIDRTRSGRLELARWLTSPDNPLTARVAVNRIWLHLFGRGIVPSIDNFGALGEKPSHPELLDWLAGRFIADGWSTKKMIRLLVLSRTYQLSSAHDPANAQADPDNIGLWRMNRRRLEAEAIRDAILAVSGQLDPTMPNGSGMTGGGGRGNPLSIRDSNLRSVYLPILRGAPLPELLALFDVANPNLSVSQREVTTVPSQALYLMNSPFVITQSRHLAERLLKTSADESARVDLAYQLAFARLPSDLERSRALAYLKQAGEGQSNAAAAWAGLCQAIFAAAEFRYLN